MIVIFLRGGLGNQIFQYALGRTLAKKYDTKLVFDTTFLRDRFPRGGVSFFNYDLDMFGIEPKLTPIAHAANAMPIPGAWLALDIALIKAKDAFGIRKIYKEAPSGAFDEAVLDAGPNALLWGYWQSERYFRDIVNELRAELKFRDQLLGEAKIVGEMMRNEGSVSLHVRRGDYVTAKNTLKLMGDTNMPYYDAAIAHIGKNIKNPHFFVISNDPAWCKENIKIPFKTTYLDNASAGPKNAYHLQLMSLAKHNIIANSTFSWWGAWLNPNPNKIVIAPKKWFNDPAMDSTNIIPSGWVQL